MRINQDRPLLLAAFMCVNVSFSLRIPSGAVTCSTLITNCPMLWAYCNFMTTNMLRPSTPMRDAIPFSIELEIRIAVIFLILSRTSTKRQEGTLSQRKRAQTETEATKKRCHRVVSTTRQP